MFYSLKITMHANRVVEIIIMNNVQFRLARAKNVTGSIVVFFASHLPT